MMWLAMVGLDHFRRLNDLHSRATAEHIMHRVAELVGELAHEHDVVARYYHDQLAVILHDPEGSRAERFAEAIRAAVERHSFEPGGHRITVSVGLADLLRYRDGVDDLVNEAYARLRRASRLGGNQVISYTVENEMCMAILRRPLPEVVSRPHLVVLHGAELGRRYEVVGRTTIGRSRSSDICVDDDSISRTHATITVHDHVRIQDQGSKNGLLVNGVALREATLQYGDVVQIGRTIFALAELDPTAPNVEVLNQVARVRGVIGGAFDRIRTDSTEADTAAVGFIVAELPARTLLANDNHGSSAGDCDRE
jgi:diguanylate cyclase (GGDEF)-like protein